VKEIFENLNKKVDIDEEGHYFGELDVEYKYSDDEFECYE